MNYQPSTIGLKSPPAGVASTVLQDSKKVPPPRPPPPLKPPHSFESQLSQPTNTCSTTHTGFMADTKESTSVSHPQLSISLTEAKTETQDERMNNATSPATGQLRPESQELTDGMYDVRTFMYHFH